MIQTDAKYGKFAAHLGTLLGGCLLFGGCSLSVPNKDDVFRQGSPGANGMDGGHVADEHDSSAGDHPDSGGGDQHVDAQVLDDAGSTPVTTQDGGGDGGGGQPFDPEDGLVVHYRFNETEGNTVHDYAGDKDALVVGTPAGHTQWVAQGRIDGALSLAGGDPPDAGTGHYVELPQGVLLGLDECSIALWVNRSGGPMWQRVFDLGSGQPVWIFFTPYGGTGLPVVAGRTPALIFVDYQPITDAPDGAGQLNINKPIPVSTWTHFVFTWSANQAKVYLDGKLIAQAAVNGGVKPTDLGNTGQNYLGRSQFSTDPYFDGLLDEFRIYNRVLSASDVAQLHDLQ